MIRHEVEQHFQSPRMCGLEKCFEILHRAKQGIDGPVVGNIIAEVLHGRLEDRRNPDRVDAQLGEIAQPARDSCEIADSVLIGVLERAGIDLIDDGGLPPVRSLHYPTLPSADEFALTSTAA